MNRNILIYSIIFVIIIIPIVFIYGNSTNNQEVDFYPYLCEEISDSRLLSICQYMKDQEIVSSAAPHEYIISSQEEKNCEEISVEIECSPEEIIIETKLNYGAAEDIAYTIKNTGEVIGVIVAET